MAASCMKEKNIAITGDYASQKEIQLPDKVK